MSWEYMNGYLGINIDYTKLYREGEAEDLTLGFGSSLAKDVSNVRTFDQRMLLLCLHKVNV